MPRGKTGPAARGATAHGRAYLSSPCDRAAGGRVSSTHVRHSNIRACPSRLRISLLRLGASRRNRSLYAGMAVSRRPEKGLGWPPNGLERGARRGRNPCPGAAARYAAAIPAMAHTQHAISRAVAQLAMHGLLPAAAMASLRSISLRLHFVAWRRVAGRPLTCIVFSDTRAGGIVWPRCPRLHSSRWTEGLPHGRQSEEVHRRVQAGDSRLRHLHGAPHNPGLRGARAQPQDGERLGAQAQARVGGRARPEGRGARASRGEEAHTRARGGERVPKKAAAFFAKEQAL